MLKTTLPDQDIDSLIQETDKNISAKYAKKLAKAFVLFCKEIGFKLQKDVYNFKNDNDLGKIKDRSSFRSYIPWKPDKFEYHRFIKDNPEEIETFLEYIFEITKAKGVTLQKKKGDEYDIPFDVPDIDEKTGRFLIEGEKPKRAEKKPEPVSPTYYLYYYSTSMAKEAILNKLNGINNEEEYGFKKGAIYLADKALKKDFGTARIVLDSPYKGAEYTAKWYKEADEEERNTTIYYGAEPRNNKRRNKNRITKTKTSYPINIIFKENLERNIFVGTYTWALNSEHFPVCGLIIAVHKSVYKNNSAEELKPLFHYLLRHRKLAEKPSFFYPFPHKQDLNKLPEGVRIWLKDIQTMHGTYACYYTNPYTQKFFKALMQIQKDGTVFLYTKRNHHDHPYTGVFKKINNADEEEELEQINNIVISLGYRRFEYEYKLRIFLNEGINSKSNLFGVYISMRSEPSIKPYSSLFAAQKLATVLSLQEIKSRIENKDDVEFPAFEHDLKTEEDYKSIISKLSDEEIKKFFMKQEGFINPISLRIHSDL